MSYKLLKQGVQRLIDGACIPPTTDNRDWLEYLKWLALGNTPQPADPDPVPIDYSNLDNLDRTLKAIGLLMRDYTNALQAGTHTQKTVAQMKADFAAKWNSLP
jgi:hypothetical protein